MRPNIFRLEISGAECPRGIILTLIYVCRSGEEMREAQWKPESNFDFRKTSRVQGLQYFWNCWFSRAARLIVISRFSVLFDDSWTLVSQSSWVGKERCWKL